MTKQPDDAIVKRLEQHGHDCAIASPVWHELSYGVRRLPRGKRRQALEVYLEDVVRAVFPILPYDEAAAAWHAAERARLNARGARPLYVEGQIAAIAQTNGIVLVTTNPKDFRSF